MQLRHLRCLRTTIEAGSIHAAAKRMGLSQPALTKALRELEHELGVPLLLRSPRGVTPTPFGQALVRRATRIDEEIGRAEEEITQMKGERQGRVAVGLSALVAVSVTSQALNCFWKIHPHGHVRIVDGQFQDLVAAIRQGRLDFAIGPVPSVDTGFRLSVEVLFENRLVPAVRKGHALAGAKSLRDLKDSRFLLTSSDDDYRHLALKEFERSGCSIPHVGVDCESYAALIEIVANSDVVALLPELLVRQHSLAERLVALAIPEMALTTKIALVRDASVPLTPKAALLAREFRAACSRYKRGQAA